MLSDSTVTPSDLMSPAVPTASALPNGISLNGTQHRSSNLKATTNDDSPAGNTAAPDAKVEKPRPHVCGTCGKGFHRLEHLKRHERSHTKEKPFECPECARCFARRDLLLRHQQKLHMTATPSSRPRSGRRESTSATAGGGPGRIRKNSLINGGMNASGPSSMRPRANTISHVDNTTLGTLVGDDVTVIRNGVGHLSGHGQLPGPGGHHYRGFSSGAGHHGLPSTLPKLDTHGFSNLEFSGGLRTAPPYGGFGLNDHDFNGMVFNPGSTINPQQLHFSDSPTSIALGNATSPFPPPFSNNVTAAQDFMDEDEDYSFRNALETRMSFPGADEQAVDNSSPSAISSTSQSGISEVMLDGSNNPAQNRTSTWQDSPLMLSGPPLTNHPYSMDMSGSIFPDMVPPPGPLSPDSLHDQHDLTDAFFSASSQLKPSSSIPLMPGYSGMDLEGGGGSMERTGTS